MAKLVKAKILSPLWRRACHQSDNKRLWRSLKNILISFRIYEQWTHSTEKKFLFPLFICLLSFCIHVLNMAKFESFLLGHFIKPEPHIFIKIMWIIFQLTKYDHRSLGRSSQVFLYVCYFTENWNFFSTFLKNHLHSAKIPWTRIKRTLFSKPPIESTYC